MKRNIIKCVLVLMFFVFAQLYCSNPYSIFNPSTYQNNAQVPDNFPSAPEYLEEEFDEASGLNKFPENQDENKTLNQKNIKNYNTSYNKITIKENGKTVIKVINNGQQSDDREDNDADLVNTGIIIGDISGFNKIKSTGIIDGKIIKNKKNNFIHSIKNIRPIQFLFLLGLVSIGTILILKLPKKNKGVLNNISNSTINISGNLIIW